MASPVNTARLADQIRDYLASWISKDFPGLIASVTYVALSPDFHQAEAWIRLEEGKEAWLERISRKLPDYQRHLYRSLSRKIVPHLSLRLDDGQSSSDRIDRLLSGGE